jgi:PDZ domain
MINNVDCTTKTGKDAIQYLLGDGYVTILADINLINEPDVIMPSIFESNMVTATAIRESPEVKLGIGLRKLDGELIISSLNETGAFSPQKTALRVGYRIVMIDNVNCANVSTEEAVQLLRERSLSSVVTVVALAHGALVPVATALSIHPAPPGRADGGTWCVPQVACFSARRISEMLILAAFSLTFIPTREPTTTLVSLRVWSASLDSFAAASLWCVRFAVRATSRMPIW